MRGNIIIKKVLVVGIICLFLTSSTNQVLSGNDPEFESSNPDANNNALTMLEDDENSTFYVDDDFNSNTPFFGIYRFNKIQDAINKVNASIDTIIVHEGIYNEDLVINKAVDIIAGIETMDCDGEEFENAPLNIKKTSNKIVAKNGEIVHYTVWVKNTGEDILIFNNITDSLVDSADININSDLEILEPDEEKPLYYNYTIQENIGPLNNTVEIHYHPEDTTIDVYDVDSCTIDINPLGYYVANIMGNIEFINNSIDIKSDGNVRFNITGNLLFENDDITINQSNIMSDCIFLYQRRNISFNNTTFSTENSKNFNIVKSEEITIKNCLISSYANAHEHIYGYKIKRCNIENCLFLEEEVDGNDNYAIFLKLSDFNNISGNSLNDSSHQMIYMEGCWYNDVFNNYFVKDSDDEGIYGNIIYLDGSNENSIRFNIIDAKISDRHQISNINHYIYLRWSNNNTVDHNILEADFDGNPDLGAGLRFLRWLFNRIIPLDDINGQMNMLYGVRIGGASGNSISYNKIKGLKVGISISQSKGNYIHGNTLLNCEQTGIYLSRNSFNLMFFNYFKDSSYAIRVHRTQEEYIMFNQFMKSEHINTGPVRIRSYKVIRGSLLRARFNYFAGVINNYLQFLSGIPLAYFLPFLVNEFMGENCGRLEVKWWYNRVNSEVLKYKWAEEFERLNFGKKDTIEDDLDEINWHGGLY